MSENAISRRSFLAGSAGVAAIAATAGLVGTQATLALAEDTSENTYTDAVHTLCDGCSNQCGYTAYTRDGKLTKLIGDAGNPASEGKLCARGYGYSQVAYSQDRLTDPMKKNAQGAFEKIDWETAFAEIGEAVKATAGDKFGIIADGSPSVDLYATRLAHALGSTNVYYPAAAKNMTVATALNETLGIDDYEVDYAKADAVVIIGASSKDAMAPATIAQMQAAAERGAAIYFIDPRQPAAANFATKWMPVKAGTEGALLLAIAHQIVSQAAYDTIAEQIDPEGFGAWREELFQYTPTWAATITGLTAAQIEDVAGVLINAAPKAAIDIAWRGSVGAGYANAGEAVRTAALVNTLLGCWNEDGCALPNVKAFIEVDAGTFKPVERPDDPVAGAEEYLLDMFGAASDAVAIKAAAGGDLDTLIVMGANPVAELPDPAYVREALDGLKTLVAVTLTLDETAELADYVLPIDSYLERSEVPVVTTGVEPSVALRSQAIDRVNENTRDIDEIIVGIAEAAGVKDFDFSQADLTDAQCKKLGLTAAGLAQVGTSALNAQDLQDNGIPVGLDAAALKVTSDAAAKAGYAARPAWTEPAATPGDGEFRMLCGDTAVNAGAKTMDTPELANIVKQYELDRVWINKAAADKLGIADGDAIVVENDRATAPAVAKVTNLIEPTSIYVPAGLGSTAAAEKTAEGIGINPMDFAAFELEPLYGAPLTQEAIVTVKKAGA